MIEEPTRRRRTESTYKPDRRSSRILSPVLDEVDHLIEDDNIYDYVTIRKPRTRVASSSPVHRQTIKPETFDGTGPWTIAHILMHVQK